MSSLVMLCPQLLPWEASEWLWTAVRGEISDPPIAEETTMLYVFHDALERIAKFCIAQLAAVVATVVLARQSGLDSKH
jgi:hypothetical protein